MVGPGSPPGLNFALKRNKNAASALARGSIVRPVKF